MNKIIKLSVATSLFALSLNADQTNDELLKIIESLQKRIEKLEASQSSTTNMIGKIEAVQSDTSKAVNKLEASQSDASDELEERIDQIETATMTDKIDLSVELRTRVDKFDSKNGAGNKFSDNNIWSNRLRLNMGAKITEDMKFNGRLAMYKNWADSNINLFSGMDPMQGRRPGDSGIFVERAYVDWTVLKGEVPVILTIGRQPSSDGPSHQFKDNTVRKATYSALSFDGAADGIVATVPLNKLSGVPGMALRFAYGKGYQDSSNMSYVGNPAGIEDSDVFGVFFDTSLGIEGSLLQVSVVQAKDMVSNTSSAGASTNTNIGDMTLYTAMLEFTNVANTNLDFFGHYSRSEANPNGRVAAQDGMGNVGLLTSIAGDTAQKNGSAYWLGARYTMPIESLNNPRIGLEYNHGSKNWFSFTQGSNDLTNKLATRGSATEVYYIQPINRYAYLRFGATMIDYDYSGTGYQIGSPMSISDMGAMGMGAAVTDKLTNYYFLFNVAY